MNTSGLLPVLLILLINYIIVLILFVSAFFQKKGHRSTMFLFSWFLFVVPFFGGLYILLGQFFRFLNRKKNVDMSDVSFNQDREKTILPPDQEIEMNYVPIQDAMAVSDTASLRRLLLDTMRNNAKRTIASIAAAMNSEDTEASHYAASIIMDALSEFRSTAQNMIENMQRLPEDVEMNLITFDYIYDVLNMKIMTKIEQESYIYTLDHVAENLFAHNLWYMTATQYLQLTDLFLSIMDFNMAEKWAFRSGQYRPNILDTYKANLHLFFVQHNQSAFLDCLQELGKSDVPVDEEIMNLFRLFGGQA